ncbi:MAG: 2-oxoglutarate dehydrogenase, E2 component, dihydrolipoamide succinyltransferase, partial [Planctomycetota bacterium]|nr:2-oxoglutarate dehydrogenase, E2 component, dihydrolipoamide succinyltransferase [Planctomycetota bacterium]
LGPVALVGFSLAALGALAPAQFGLDEPLRPSAAPPAGPRTSTPAGSDAPVAPAPAGAPVATPVAPGPAR